MSAFVHDVAHIRALVNAGLQGWPQRPLSWGSRALTDEERESSYERGLPWGAEAVEIARAVRRQLTPGSAGMIGAMLLAENQRSVNFRYDEDELEPIYIHGADARAYSPVEILAAITSYEYQACEHPGWEESEAQRFCLALRDSQIRLLPGYRNAETWAITSTPTRAR